MKKRTILLVMLVAAWFFLAVDRLDAGRQAQGKRQLEDALRRTAVTCYASEGFYPPNLGYMQEHYGLQYDAQKYIVHYDIFAANLMPEITVVEVGQ